MTVNAQIPGLSSNEHFYPQGGLIMIGQGSEICRIKSSFSSLKALNSYLIKVFFVCTVSLRGTKGHFIKQLLSSVFGCFK